MTVKPLSEADIYEYFDAGDTAFYSNKVTYETLDTVDEKAMSVNRLKELFAELIERDKQRKLESGISVDEPLFVLWSDVKELFEPLVKK